ncbi:porphobilinogen synthase [Clostridium sp. AL.422]|uniref:porphobilinogen synthase n=1 Tax=Clostridium TaxID=1485 RepID=UPI00293DB7DF|nr:MULTISPECIES: porphobilinogen synthase [unclassified Clostridium]MDV4149460.1 porphobilinogen synthase [Clostridium sp. AL.422]
MIKRGRRLRATSAIRDLVRENILSSNDFIFPIFVVEGNNKKEEISSMKGNYHWSLDRLPEIINEVTQNNIRGIILFGVPNHKDDCGSESYNDNGIVQQAIRKMREISKDLYIIADVCMCQYTSHGHCGILNGNEVDNDKTLEILGKISLSYANAGANMVAPSDMMDGRIGYIREVLDKNHYENVAIMSYAAKYSSAFYGPFREAAHSAPQFGDRKTYQMDPANSEEAIKEIEWDINEGADIIMVKPAMSYLDIIRRAKEKVNVPICAYNVSGEFAMVKAAAEAGLINEKSVALEMLLSMKRAGADIIITYFALDAVRWLKENN